MPGLVFHAEGFFSCNKKSQADRILVEEERENKGNKELICQVTSCAGIAVRMC